MRLAAVVFVVLVLFTLWISYNSPLSRTLLNQKPVIGLVIGMQLSESPNVSDEPAAFILIQYHPMLHSADVLSIPHNTKVEVPNFRAKRLNEIYTDAYTAHPQNPDAACKEVVHAVQWILGDFPLEIPYYIQTDTSWLNKQNTLEYVKFKSDFVLGKIATNLNWLERLLILIELKNIKQDRIHFMQFAGTLRQGFWIPEPNSISAVVNLLTGKSTAIHSKVTTVDVLNASGKSGLALKVARQLRNTGFDVVKWGNYPALQQKTLIRDHKGNPAQTKAIAEILGVPNVEVLIQVETNPLVDVEVILGEDFKNDGDR